MNITYYTINPDTGGETEVESWKECTHCILDLAGGDRQQEILEAGIWVGIHKKDIADFALFDSWGDMPYVEVYKRRKP